MRWVLWDETTSAVPDHVLDEMMRFIGGALGRGARRSDEEDS
jgi:hypothetical protein